MLTNPTRRMILGAAALAAVPRVAGAQAETCDLPDAAEGVRAILADRRSTRSFAARDVEEPLRSVLLWAATGINRPENGGRTSPSWHGAGDELLHVAHAAGVDRYDPATGAATRVLDADIRGRLSPQPFVATAPLCLIHVSDLSRLDAAAEVDAADRRVWAHVDAAVAAQNVYLFCAAAGLGTCLVGGADGAAIATALSLGEDRLVTFVQPVGWPA